MNAVSQFDETADPADWIGRVEERTGALTTELAGMLAGALGQPAAPAPRIAPGAPMPWLWHWSAFPEFVPIDELGRDGHPRLGRFLPPVPLERRMWAGGQLDFEGVLRIGETLYRRSEIKAVTEKEGATGRMVFVTVDHRITGAEGHVSETQDIVYLAIPDTFRPPRPIPAPDAPVIDEVVAMSEARLFRFSAATYNAHRIHYDLPYAVEVEKYPGLVVHGPMQAMLLMEAATRHTGRPPARFRFRGVHPMFHQDDLRLCAVGDGAALDLCTVAEGKGQQGGHQGLQARFEGR